MHNSSPNSKITWKASLHTTTDTREVENKEDKKNVREFSNNCTIPWVGKFPTESTEPLTIICFLSFAEKKPPWKAHVRLIYPEYSANTHFNVISSTQFACSRGAVCFNDQKNFHEFVGKSLLS